MDYKNKLYHSISEVCTITGVQTYILRYWESEFRVLNPHKTSGGRRAYTPEDIDLILLIKKLLYEDKYSIEGARRKLEEGYHPKMKQGSESPSKTGKPAPQTAGRDVLEEMRTGLKEVLEVLE